jgi:protein gp37
VSNWKKPFTWDRKVRETGYRPRVMCGSLCDVFDNEIPMAWRNDLWMTIRNTPNLRWMLITKRIGNVPDMLPEDWTDVGAFAHVGIIATMVTQDEIDRDVSKLVSVPSAWWGISVEPQLGAIVLPSKLTNHAARFPGRVWIISGGESYQPQIHDSRADVRGYDLKWAFSLKAQCALAGIAYFQKQLGARPHVAGVPYACALDPDAGANINDWPVPLRVQEFPGPLK